MHRSATRVTFFLPILFIFLGCGTKHQTKPEPVPPPDAAVVVPGSTAAEDAQNENSYTMHSESCDTIFMPETPQTAEAVALFHDFLPFPSARHNISDSRIRHDMALPTLGEVSRVLETRLNHAGYQSRWVYYVPDSGFILVTEMEQIDATGKPAVENRWCTSTRILPDFSLDYVAYGTYRLFHASDPPGYFRVIVFIVSDNDYTIGPPTPGPQASQWQLKGQIHLPRERRNRPFNTDYSIAAFVYMYYYDGDSALTFFQNGVSGEDHLLRSGIIRSDE